MRKPIRIIPVLFLKNGLIVRSKNFDFHQSLGNIIHQAERLSNWKVDELIYIDISRQSNYDLGRDDLNLSNTTNIIKILTEISKFCFMPLTFGGRIRTCEQAVEFIRTGCDKITLNTLFFENHNEIKQIVKYLGSQAVVASIDYKIENNKYFVYKEFGKENTKILLEDHIKVVEKLGAGEILLQNIQNDGSAKGFDLTVMKKIGNIKLPVILCSGAGNENHFVDAASNLKVSALAAGNYFNFKELSYPNVKKKLKDKNIYVR